MREQEIKDIKTKLENKIIGRERYFNSAVLASVVKIDGELNFLLQKRAKDIRQGGEICFPGGKKDKEDKTFEETAIRETVEELGVQPQDVKVFGKIGTVVTPAGVIVESYIGQLMCEVKDMKVNEDEVEKLLVIPVSYFKNTPPTIEKIAIEMSPHYVEDGKEQTFPAEAYNMNEVYHKPWKGMDRTVYIYEYCGEVIWGITAEIIYEVVNKIL